MRCFLLTPPPSNLPSPQQEEDNPDNVAPTDGHDFEDSNSTPKSSIPVVAVDIATPFQLRSADDLKTPYSNYTSGYQALLDYVWYDPAVFKVSLRHSAPAYAVLDLCMRE